MEELPGETKQEVVPSKKIVNTTFSNSFGLHVALVTADKPPMFIFTRRAKLLNKRLRKDRPQNEKIVAVEFILSTMVKFVGENFKNFASSAKLVVVKVLQSFFGYAAVEREFSVVREETEG